MSSQCQIGPKVSDENDWQKKHAAGAIDYHNPCRSECLIATKRSQISNWISAMMTYELE